MQKSNHDAYAFSFIIILLYAHIPDVLHIMMYAKIRIEFMEFRLHRQRQSFIAYFQTADDN